MSEEFVCESIKPVRGTIDVGGMLRGEPGLPKKFIWRKQAYEVDEVLERWKETAPCRSGSRERYLRKHWFRIRTTSGHEMKVYFERQSRSAHGVKTRWWLYTVSEG